MKFIIQAHGVLLCSLISACGGQGDRVATPPGPHSHSLSATPDNPAVSVRKAKCRGATTDFPVATMNYGAGGEQGFRLSCTDADGLVPLLEAMGTTWEEYNAMAPENCDTLNQQLSYRANPPLTCTTAATRQLFSYHDVSVGQIKYFAFLGEQPGRSILRMLGCTELVEALGFDILDAEPLSQFFVDLFLDLGDAHDLSCKGGTPIQPRRRATCSGTAPANAEFFRNGTALVDPQTTGFEQTWDVATASWVPSEDACEWRCLPVFYAQDGNTCRLGDSKVDPTFNPVFLPEKSVSGVLVQDDGKFMVTGSFTHVNDIPRPGLVRLNSDGTTDLSFVPALSATLPYGVTEIALQENGQYLVHRPDSNEPAGKLIRINTDGSRDTTYRADVDGSIYAIALQSDGKAIIGGIFSTVDGASRYRLARLNVDGRLDTSFNQGTGFPKTYDWGFMTAVYAVAVQPNGKIVVGGGFSSYDGVPRTSFLRLNPNGSIDASFTAQPTFSTNDGYPAISDIVAYPDGKLLVSGDFQSMNTHPDAPSYTIARLNDDGSLDTSFVNPYPGYVYAEITKIAVGAGMIAIGGYGWIRSDGTLTAPQVGRLYADGAPDTSFDPSGFLRGIYGSFTPDVGIQADGHVVATNVMYNDGVTTSYRGMVRLSPQ